jgi:hypothetical protein
MFFIQPPKTNKYRSRLVLGVSYHLHKIHYKMHTPDAMCWSIAPSGHIGKIVLKNRSSSTEQFDYKLHKSTVSTTVMLP